MIKKVPTNIDFIRLEHEVLKFWDENKIFEKLVKKNSNRPKWSFIDGPITANNPMGVHHAWGRTYKDIFHRYKAMTGFRTRYQNGFDCQGLWVEVEVEKALGFKSKRDIEDYGIERFVNKCKERVWKYSKIQTQQSIRLGYWMDWENSYYTMSDENNYTIWLFLKKCYENGWIYKGHDVMPWCTKCGAALSEHEIATEGYKELTHTSVTLKFPLINRKGEYILVWTTTPWTLTSNTAAAVHPDKTYIKVKQDGEIYYLIESREEILKGNYTVEGSLTGKNMVGWTYKGPFDELPVQKGVKHVIIPWSDVTETEGTGIVHIAPGCGQEDFRLGKEYNLSVIDPLDEFGNYIDGFNWLSGMNVSNITELILKDLKEKNLLYLRERYTHRYPVCWRHGTELVFRLVDEWFISMNEVRESMMDVTRQIRWIPEYGMDRELDWLRNMSDWMISKKRFWGLALPIYECPSCGNIEVIGSKEELRSRAVEGWDKFEGNSPHRPWIDAVKICCKKCGMTVSRIPDVGNPWLDAGIVPFSTLHYTTDKKYWEEWFPADFICESLPGQFRNWFYSILAMSTVLESKPPTKAIFGHALVKDEQGKEMHKSAGNAIWFDEAAEKIGVDVMRWLYATHNPVTNLNFGYNIAREIRKQLITLWNSYCFFATYAELDKYFPEKHKINKENLSELDLWLLARLNLMYKETKVGYESYAVDKVMKSIYAFLEDLSNWYIRRSRRRFWKSENDVDKWGAYQTLYQALKGLILILAPVIPFVTEAIYQNLVRGLETDARESVHLENFPEADESLIDKDLVRKINSVIRIVSLGRAARNKANLKIRQPLRKIVIKLLDDQLAKDIDLLQSQILEELNIKQLEITKDETLLINYNIKPNLSILGPKYKQYLNAIQEKLQEIDPVETASKIDKGDSIVLNLDGKMIYLTGDDIIIERKDIDGFAVVSDSEYTVGVDINLTDELVKEGIIRDFVRHIQTMRKEAGFQVEDRIVVAFESTNDIGEVLDDYMEYFKNETLAVKVQDNFSPGEYEKEIKLGKNRVHVAISRVT